MKPYLEQLVGDKKIHVITLRDWCWRKEARNDFSKFWVTEIHVQDDKECGVIRPGSFVFSKSQNARGIIIQLVAQIHIEPFSGVEGRNHSTLYTGAIGTTVDILWFDPVEVDPAWKSLYGEIVPLEKLLNGNYCVRENHPFEKISRPPLLTYVKERLLCLPAPIDTTNSLHEAVANNL